MQRRTLLAGGIVVPLTLGGHWAAEAAQPPAPTPDPHFDADTVRNLARALAQKPFAPPDASLPAPLDKLTYDQYRMIRFDTGKSLWRGTGLPFEVQFFHRGFLYNQRVDLFEVQGNTATPIAYNPDMFDFGAMPRPQAGDIGFAGFRVHAPINRADYMDEVCVFLGASYFRAVAKGESYGLSARGLAIKTADPAGEEFPAFRRFWLERPQPGTGVLVIYALLDSLSAAAAYRFTIRPGEQTVFDVESTIYPRVDINAIGLGTMTSMFDFDASDRQGIDDYRPAVHDSDGLLMLTGRGEQLWRPLANPHKLQISVFGDASPRGFGLMQRARAFADYNDLEAHYETRPSLWVEPIGDAGEGAVILVEIPTQGEVHDNIVAFWRPKQKIAAKSEFGLTYRLHWCADQPFASGLARIMATSAGAASSGGNPDPKIREFVIDIAGDKLKAMGPGAKLHADIATDHGKIVGPIAQFNPETGGWRMAFKLDTNGTDVAEMRATLKDEHGPVAETWVYRWTA